MNKPYVGVTGPVSEDEVREIAKSFERNSLSMQGPRIPMIGILISYKTLDFGKHPENRRYPPLKKIPALLETAGKKSFNTIHFNTKRPEALSEDLSTVFNLENIYDKGDCHGVQFNLAWPPAEEVDKLRSDYPDLKTIIQLSKKAISNLPVEDIVKKTKEYDADYALIDLSGGRGKPLNMKYSSFLYNSLKEGGVDATIGFAGGLSGENAENVIKSLIIETGSSMLSIDAEGNLRDRLSDRYGDDEMNMEKVASYIEAAVRGFLNSQI
jgi:hypothetical protein